MRQCLGNRLFSHDQARESYRAGETVAKIAARLRVSRQAVHAVIEPGDRNARRSALAKRKNTRRDALKERARALRKAGIPLLEIGRRLGIGKTSASRLTAGVQPLGWKAPRSTAAKNGTPGIPVWISRNGLTEDYRDFLREFGKGGALHRCRQLAAEMRSGLA